MDRISGFAERNSAVRYLGLDGAHDAVADRGVVASLTGAVCREKWNADDGP